MPPKKKKSATKRPPPCPAPPASLVKLLKEDASVLSYFGALQANLQADVDVWKARAQNWERQVKTLQTKLRKQQNASKQQSSPPKQQQSTTTTVGTKRRRPRSSTDDDIRLDSDDPSSSESKALLGNKNGKTGQIKKKFESWVAPKLPADATQESARTRHNQLMEGAKEITEDDLLLLSISSSDSDSDDGSKGIGDTGEMITPPPVEENETSKEASQSATKSPAASPKNTAESAAASKAEEADSDTEQTQGNSQSESETVQSYRPDYAQQAEKVPPETKQYFVQVTDILTSLEIRLVDDEKRHRSDEMVCNDVKTTLDWLCRHAYSEEEMLHDHPPFSQQLPATADDHLARQAFRMVVQAFFLLDTYGEQWANTDLVGRQDILSVLEKQLCDEIVCEAPRRDRTGRLTEPTSFFSPTDHVTMEEDSTSKCSTALDDCTRATQISPKSLPKLLVLLERVGWAQILIGIQLSRNDIPAAARIVRDYILSTVPSLGQEESSHYPRLAPILSFVVLEAMITTNLKAIGWDWDTGKSDVENTVSLYSQVWGNALTNTASSVYAISLRHTANVWQQRAKSCHDRVRQVAQLEFAAYQRLCRNYCLGVLDCDSENLHKAYKTGTWNLISPSDVAGYQLLLVFKGSFGVSTSSLTWEHEKDRDWNLTRIVCWFTAIRQMCLRRLSETKDAVGTPAALENSTHTASLVEKCRKQFISLWECNPFQGNVDKALVLATLLKSASLLADGDSVFFYSDQLFALLETMNPADYDKNGRACLLVPVWKILRHVTELPLARVINLRRRPDRWQFMLGKAMEEGFLIVRGVTRLRAVEAAGADGSNNNNGNNYAFDGKWPHAQLLEQVGSSTQFAKLIETEWYPVQLAPFDLDAPKHDKPIRMHASEVACALSHIASWRACNPSLHKNPHHHQSSCGLIGQPAVFRRAFEIAGYARGAPLHWKNGAMPPTPVWLILEDDAHVEKAFNEKLDALLKELPRDFHYCALGYSRPKSAPILSPWPSRPRIGIPTHLFFATGYIVSQTGLKYLNENGPVQGPVDVWLGLLQTRNFDNLVGQRLGVGSHGKGGTLTSSTAASLMNFMAYCAVPVLCQQPLAKRNPRPAGGRRRWKEKDTDIVYSGHSY